jgi:predicted SprT family Zn-dependent metalloprotease
MNLITASVLANTLLSKHGLTNKGWSFQFDNSLRRFGVCKYRTKVIGLSKSLTALNSVEEVKDTILHEIAHAIAGYKAGHGVDWKMVCIRIGARPVRCYTRDNVVTPKLKYVAICGGCKKEHEKARIVKNNRRVACKCQSHLSWDKKHLLIYKER